MIHDNHRTSRSSRATYVGSIDAIAAATATQALTNRTRVSAASYDSAFLLLSRCADSDVRAFRAARSSPLMAHPPLLSVHVLAILAAT